MNLGQSNAALVIVDLLTGARSFDREKVVEALQLLAYDAGRKLQTSRRPVEVRDAAVRLHELVARADADALAEAEWDKQEQAAHRLAEEPY